MSGCLQRGSGRRKADPGGPGGGFADRVDRTSNEPAEHVENAGTVGSGGTGVGVGQRGASQFDAYAAVQGQGVRSVNGGAD